MREEEEEEIPAGPYLIDEVSFHEKVPLSAQFLARREFWFLSQHTGHNYWPEY